MNDSHHSWSSSPPHMPSNPRMKPSYSTQSARTESHDPFLSPRSPIAPPWHTTGSNRCCLRPFARWTEDADLWSLVFYRTVTCHATNFSTFCLTVRKYSFSSSPSMVTCLDLSLWRSANFQTHCNRSWSRFGYCLGDYFLQLFQLHRRFRPEVP